MGNLSHIQCIDDARHAARRRLPRMLFDFIDGAAGRGRTSRRNRDTLDGIHLQPRVLVNVEQRTLETRFLDTSYALPFGVAPMGMCALSWPGADRALANLAARANVPVGVSTAASMSLEDYYPLSGGNAWFQLYVSQSEQAALDLVRRAGNAGYETLVFTVDTPEVARRPREARSGFQVPFRPGPRQVIDFALHPRWSLTTLLRGVPSMANFDGPGRAVRDDGAGATFNREQSRGGVDWQFLDRLRDAWHGRLIVKGVLFPSDAVRLRDAGIDAVYVSNHGGRQLDSAPAAITMLPLVRQAVGAEYPLLFDSGVRCGEGIIKALALGADFVMLGRPMLYALGAAGEAGLQRIVELLALDIDKALAQLGCTSVAELDARVIARTPRDAPGTAVDATHNRNVLQALAAEE